MKKHFAYWLLLSLVFFHLSGIAQLSSMGPHLNKDSLKLLLQRDYEDTDKAFHTYLLAREMVGENKDTAITLGYSALKLSEKMKWAKGIAYSNIIMGWCYQSEGNFVQGLNHFDKALEQGQLINSKRIVSISYGNIGIIYHAETDYNRAIKYYEQSLLLDKEMSDKWGIARNIGLIGNSYYELGQFAKAKEYLFQALAQCRELNNQNGVAVWSGDLGNVYRELKIYDSALQFHLNALNIFNKLGNKWSSAEENCDIGITYRFLHQYTLSAGYLYKAVNQCREIKANDFLKNSFEALANLFGESNISLPDSTGTKMLSIVEMRTQALMYYKLFIDLRDTIFGKEQLRKQLYSEMELKVNVEKMQQEKKSALIKSELQTQKIVRNAFIAGSILLVLLIAVLFSRNKLNRKIEMEKMRNRLSRDLHDDIGSTLSSINILSRTLRYNTQHSSDDKAKASLEKINERSQRLLTNMSDIIWNINPANDSVNEMLSRMREYATSMLEAKNIEYTFNFPTEKIDKLPMEIKSNLYLIFKEAVNNLSKYSGATKVILSLSFIEKNIHLTIEDNGQGFDINEIKHRGGLTNMQHRADEMNAVLTINSIIGKATIIDLRI